MLFNKIPFFIFGVMFFSIFYSGCIEKPLEPVMPEWDIVMNIPLTDDYTLGELLDKKKSSFDNDPKRDSLIIYKMNLKIDPIRISDKDNMNFATKIMSRKVLISEIKFQPSQQFNYNYTLSQFFSNLPTSTTSPVPPISGITQTGEVALDNFQEFSLDSGLVRMTFINPFPFDIIFDKITVLNNSSTNKTEIGTITGKKVSAYSSATDSSISLVSKKVLNNIKISFIMSTPGTGTSAVYLSPIEQLKISIQLKNLKINSAIAAIGSQSYNLLNTTIIDNTDASIINAKIKSGYLYIKIDNYTSLGAAMAMSFPEIKNGNNQFLINDLNFNANQKMPQRTYNLAGWTVYPINNILTSGITINTYSTNNQMVTLKGTDSIAYSFMIDDVTIESMNGRIMSSLQKSVSLPNEDIDKYFNGSITLSEANVNINLNNGTNLPFDLKNCYLIGYNSKTGKPQVLNIDNTTILPKNKTIITPNPAKTTEFFNSFSRDNSFPRTVNFYGDILVNTNSNTYTFSSSDTIGGNVDVSIPLKLSMKGMSYKDTIDVKIEDSNKDELDKFNMGKLTIHATNWLATNAGLKICLLDKNSKKIFNLPKLSLTNPADTMFILTSSKIDNNGSTTGSQESVFEILLEKTDIGIIKNAVYAEITINFNTPSSALVSFKRSDLIKVKLSSSFGYRVSK